MTLPPTSPLLVVLSAPSGAGKTTLCNAVLGAYSDFVRAVTCTTRPARQGEVEAVDYYFLQPEVFELRVGAGDFLEHATVHGFSYGTLKEEIMGKLRRGRSVLLNVDVQGAAAVRAQAEKDPELKGSLVTVFLTPPSLAILEERLFRRGLDSPETIQRRLKAAAAEIEQHTLFDYLIISTTIPEDFRRMQVIIEAEKMRPARLRLSLF